MNKVYTNPGKFLQDTIPGFEVDEADICGPFATPEQRMSMLRAYELCKPKIGKPLKGVIMYYGTGGEI